VRCPVIISAAGEGKVLGGEGKERKKKEKKNKTLFLTIHRKKGVSLYLSETL